MLINKCFVGTGQGEGFKVIVCVVVFTTISVGSFVACLLF
jgi:hypothetical protein